MKITPKPNIHSMRMGPLGTELYEMVDLVVGDTVWGCVHIDTFWEKDARSDMYERLLHGETVFVSEEHIGGIDKQEKGTPDGTPA